MQRSWVSPPRAVSRSTASYKPEHHPVQSFPSHVITTPNGPVRLQGESGVAARLVPVTVDDLILAVPRRTGSRKALRAGTGGARRARAAARGPRAGGPAAPRRYFAPWVRERR